MQVAHPWIAGDHSHSRAQLWVGVEVDPLVGRHVQPAMIRGDQQRGIRGQQLDQAGQQRIDADRRGMPLGRTDAEHVRGGVEFGGVGVDQPGCRMHLLGH